MHLVTRTLTQPLPRKEHGRVKVRARAHGYQPSLRTYGGRIEMANMLTRIETEFLG